MDMKKRPANLKYGIWEEHHKPSYWARWLISYHFTCVMVGALIGAVLTLVLIGSV
jgi:uncharacterized BrkB/YihY/UPF0761 family membrane protein